MTAVIESGSPSEATPPDSVSINDFVDELVVALMNTKIYWSEHPRVDASVEELLRILPALGQSLTRASIEVTVYDRHLVFDRRPLLGATMSSPRLIQALEKRGAGGFQIDCDVEDRELRTLLELLVGRGAAADKETCEQVNAALQREHCSSIRFVGMADRAGIKDEEYSSAQAIAVPVYQQAVETLQDTMVSLCHGGTIDFAMSQGCIEGVLSTLNSTGGGSLLSAVRYEKYDAYTFGHSIRVAVLALEFARTLTQDQELLNRIGTAALLHDVGKSRVPFEVLHCRTRLDAEQRREMERHPEYGAEILLDHEACDPMAIGAAFGHHLDPQGRGYPKMLHSPKVSLVTQIVKLCDVFEALTAVRPYKAAMSPVRAFRIMMDMGDSFDRRLLKRFIRAIGIYPDGTRVLLADGREATVVAQSERLNGPRIQIETDEEGDALDPERCEEQDLSELLRNSSGCAGCIIERSLGVFPEYE